MEWQQAFVVVDKRLSAPRGVQFSASGQSALPADDFADDGPGAQENLEQPGVEPNTAISEDNVGFKLLQKMGWKGKGLGKNEDGIVEPVKGGVDPGVRLGLGKQEQDSFFTSAENIQRKPLEAEVQANEDEARTRKREQQAELEELRRQEVSQVTRKFFCEMCNKQYQTAMEMEAHLSSYDHHHRKRLQETKALTNQWSRSERQKREQRELEKQLAKFNEQYMKAQQAATAPSAAEPASAPPAEQALLSLPASAAPLSFGLKLGAGGKKPLAGGVKRAAAPAPVRQLKKPAAKFAAFGESDDDEDGA